MQCTFGIRFYVPCSKDLRLPARWFLPFSVLAILEKIDEEEAISTCRNPAKYTENQLIGAAAFEVLRKDLPPKLTFFYRNPGDFQENFTKILLQRCCHHQYKVTWITYNFVLYSFEGTIIFHRFSALWLFCTFCKLQS